MRSLDALFEYDVHDDHSVLSILLDHSMEEEFVQLYCNAPGRGGEGGRGDIACIGAHLCRKP